MNEQVLEGELQHHWAGATGGVAFFHRVARTHPDPEAATVVGRLAVEIEEDREQLRTIMASLGFAPSAVATATARAGEWAGRFKPNGRLLRRSPLSDVLELEGLRIAVSGKRIGWQFLRALADEDARIDAEQLDRLIERADEQLGALREVHLKVALDRALS